MTNRFMENQLVNGYIHNWLVAGPEGQAVEEGEGSDWRLNAVHRVLDAGLSFDVPPVERGKLNDSLVWQYIRCREDHLVEVPAFAPVRQVVSVWAYSRLTTETPGENTLAFSTQHPADVWVNGKQVFRSEGFIPDGKLQTNCFSVTLKAENEIVLRLVQAGVRSLPLKAALRIEGPAVQSTKVLVPTQARFPHRVRKFEELFERAYLEEAASYRGRVVQLRFDEAAQGAGDDMRYSYSIQDEASMIYVEGTWDPDPATPFDVGHPQRIFERPGWVVLRAPGKEYFDQNLRYQRALPIYILDNEFSSEPYGDYASRRQEALADAARRDGILFAEPAKMLLEKWNQIDKKVISAAIEKVSRCEAGSELLLVGLLGMTLRFAEHASFPRDLFEGLEEAATHYFYSPDESRSGVDDERESSALLVAAAELLAGQAYPDRSFSVSGQTGLQHQEAAGKKIVDWLRLRGEKGFMEWDSPEGLERTIVALSHLVSLAENETVRDFSAVLLDKVLFLMAVNSYQGILGGSMGSASAAFESSALKSARLQPTAGVARLLWGTGIYTAELAGVVSLALAEYEFPSFYADMATNRLPEMWCRERHQAARGEVNKVVYRTPDYLLGSAQDYHPGAAGKTEHIWQATLGSDALVFVNHPASFNQDAKSQPGFWLGNGILPRVAQWKDTLVAVYHLPDDAWIDFTHAYFPVHLFDETAFEGGWAFARKGQGYVAITASAGFELIKQAPDGYRELRSQGRKNVWVCQMGRMETDGNFRQFQDKVLAVKPEWRELGVRLSNPRGEEIEMGWEGAFQVNHQDVPLSNYPHVENPYCQAAYPAGQMDIQYEDLVLRLDFK